MSSGLKANVAQKKERKKTGPSWPARVVVMSLKRWMISYDSKPKSMDAETAQCSHASLPLVCFPLGGLVK
jgi:hypothetical protein